MRILIIFNRYESRGGEDTYVDNLALLLKKRGHIVKTYIKDSRDISTLFEKIRAGFGLFWNFQTASELDSLIKKFKPHVAHFHNIYPLISPTSYYICHANKVRIVQTIHNYKFMCPKNSLFRNGKMCELCVNKSFFYPSIVYGCYHHSQLASLIYSLSFAFHRLIGAFNLINLYIFPSPFTKDYYVDHFDIPTQKTLVLPHFVQVGNKISTERRIGNYFLYVGRLSEEKGVEELLSVVSTTPQHSLVVVGGGPLLNSLRMKYSLYKNIQFVGELKHSLVAVYMRKSLAVIVPSKWYEVLPYVILEAISNKTPLLIYKTINMSRLYAKTRGISLYTDSSLKKLLTKHSLAKTATDYTKISKSLTPSVHINTLLQAYLT